jgi:hypothetical protein
MRDKTDSVIVVDFDLTIAKVCFPTIVDIMPYAREVINGWWENNVIVINTCRTGRYEGDAVKFLKEMGVKFDWVNCNPPHLIESFGMDCRKLSGNLYVDDKQLGGLPKLPTGEVDWLKIKRIAKQTHEIQ